MGQVEWPIPDEKGPPRNVAISDVAGLGHGSHSGGMVQYRSPPFMTSRVVTFSRNW